MYRGMTLHVYIQGTDRCLKDEDQTYGHYNRVIAEQLTRTFEVLVAPSCHRHHCKGLSLAFELTIFQIRLGSKNAGAMSGLEMTSWISAAHLERASWVMTARLSLRYIELLKTNPCLLQRYWT